VGREAAGSWRSSYKAERQATDRAAGRESDVPPGRHGCKRVPQLKRRLAMSHLLSRAGSPLLSTRKPCRRLSCEESPPGRRGFESLSLLGRPQPALAYDRAVTRRRGYAPWVGRPRARRAKRFRCARAPSPRRAARFARAPTERRESPAGDNDSSRETSLQVSLQARVSTSRAS
jgi:hypothetical protein